MSDRISVSNSFIIMVGLALLATSAWGHDDANSKKRFTLDLEFTAAWMGRNDAAIPGDSGTRFSLNDLTGRGAFNAVRTTLTYEGEQGTGYRLLYAPFRISGTGQLSQPVNFQGTDFGAGKDTTATYQFSSYRFTWRNRWKKGPNSDWRIGATFKIRDAEITLTQSGTTKTERDAWGIVPGLLHIYGEEKLGSNWKFIVDFDGLAAPQGRAFDIGLKLGCRISDSTDLVFGYRTLEGGASNDRVYSFAWISYATMGLQHRF